MKIAKFFVSSQQASTKSLKEIDMTKKSLGSIVALVGKNGAGKSRILSFVKNYIDSLTPIQLLDGYLGNVPAILVHPFEKEIESAANILKGLKNNSNPTADVRNTFEGQISSQLSEFAKRFKVIAQPYIKVIDNDDLKVVKDNINSGKVSFEYLLSNEHLGQILSNPNLVSQYLQNPSQSNVILNEFTAFNNQSTINYLSKLANEIIVEEFRTYQENRDTPELVRIKIREKKSFQLFEKFKGYVKEFLGREFDYRQRTTDKNTVESDLYYNGQPFTIDLLSPGQKTLFAYAILFFFLDVNSKTNIRESIIIIDEPEKHLHPEAQVLLMNALRKIVSERGQIWLATHSINILAHLEFDEIFMVKDDGIILPSRTTPGRSFLDLMGIESHIDELSSFVNSISEWAYGHFMLQCFKEPDVIFSNSTSDPQFRLFKKFIEPKQAEAIQMLDYGAGKGRIGYTIGEDLEISPKIIYSAFEPSLKNHEFLKKVPNINGIYSTEKEISSNSFHLVVLCNVLHEIHPNKWWETLMEIKRILRPDGYLIFIEDRYIPKGETAEGNDFGYLILGRTEIKQLLNSVSSIDLTLSDPAHTDRIVFCAFLKEEIQPTQESVLTSIKTLNENCFSNIKKFRRNRDDASQGRIYANETQLYINSLLALEALSVNSIQISLSDHES